jgi:predicted AAA+ superfamily ATPase
MTGKSTWLKGALPQALWIDLLEEGNFQRYLSDPEALATELEAFKRRHPTGWVVIDEIQRIPSLLNEVHRALESSKLKFALSGSSARQLKRGGANLLAGRAIERHLFPLTLEEWGGAFSLNEALRTGALPGVVNASDDDKKRILRTYVSTYLKEEIQAEGIVRSLPAFSKFLQLAAECVSQEVNASSISRETTVTSKTIGEYFRILEDTLIGFFVPPWTRSVRKQLAGSPKFYFFDNGVTNALTQNLTDAPSGAARGILFEQWIVQEVRAALSYNEIDASLYYWKARGGNEVDLVIARGSKPVLAIEIKSTSMPNVRDTAGLKSFSEEYPKVACVLVGQNPKEQIIGGVRCLPYAQFLTKDLVSFF